MSDVPPITSNTLHSGDRILKTGGNIQFEKEATYIVVQNSGLNKIEKFFGENGIQALLNRTQPTISEEA